MTPAQLYTTALTRAAEAKREWEERHRAYGPDSPYTRRAMTDYGIAVFAARRAWDAFKLENPL